MDIEKIKSLIQSGNPKESIPQLLALQNEVHEKNKKFARLACLGLLEMEHDFQNMRKYIQEWNLASTFGKEFLKRMQKRVVEDQDIKPTITELEILSELDRLNQLYWRKCSPKKSYPEYAPVKKEDHQKKNEEQKSLKNRIQIVQDLSNNSIPSRNSLFSRVSFGTRKDDKFRQLPSQNIFRLKASKDSEDSSKSNANSVAAFSKKGSGSQTSILKKKGTPFKEDIRLPSEEIRRLDERIQKKINAPMTPQKQIEPLKGAKLRYGNSNIKEVQEADSFEFSAVKIQKAPISRIPSNSPQMKHPPPPSPNNSLFQFSEDRIKPDRQYEAEYAALSPDDFSPKRQDRVFGRTPVNKPLYSAQEMSLIEPDIPPSFTLRNILKSEGYGALDLLARGLQERSKKIK